MRFIQTFIVITCILVSIDFYVWQGVKVLIQNLTQQTQKYITYIYWGYTIFCFLFFASIPFFNFRQSSMGVRILMALMFAIIVLKIIWVLFLLIDDVRRLFTSTVQKGNPLKINQISRSKFLQWTGLGIGATFFGSMVYGITKGAHKYTLHTKKLKINNLPASFEGLKIVQISDVHSGSFYDKQAVQKGIDLINAQNPDIVFFTGDLVNDRATEFEAWKPLFASIKAKIGIYSTLGNHDYGDYVQWKSPEEKEQNLKDLIKHHTDMGWNILMDEAKIIEKNNDKLAIIGIQNWSAKRNFPKYGDLAKAYAFAKDIPTKLLLSHDPSHWKEEVLANPTYNDIAVTFSGHTHGMQFGIDTSWYKWSPVKFVYKEWIDLYAQGNQQLYVNRGFGFLGFPGRVGMWPEISVFNLTATA